VMVEISSLVLLKNFPGASFIAEHGLLRGLGELPMLSCRQESLERLHNTAQPTLPGKRFSILGCLGVRTEEEITLTCVHLQ